MAQQYGYQNRNQYDQRDESYNGGRTYGAPAMGRDEFSSQNVEMEPLTKNASDEFKRQDPNTILNSCRDIDRGLDDIKRPIQEWQDLQKKSLDAVAPSRAFSEQMDILGARITAQYRDLAARVKQIKQNPESRSPRNSAQVRRVDAAVKKSIGDYQKLELGFRTKLRDQVERQYRIVSPDWTEEQLERAVDAAVDNPDQLQIFGNAAMQSNRQGQANETLNSVKQRSAAIQKIERDFQELANLMIDMDNLVMQQDEAVVNIELKGEEVVENLDKGTEQIGVAIQSARNARKWKWWCLGICVLIVVIIVIIVLIYKFVIQNNAPAAKSAKRFVLSDFISTEKLSAAGHRVVSGQPWTPSSKIVVPGVGWSPDSETVGKAIVRKTRPFQA